MVRQFTYGIPSNGNLMHFPDKITKFMNIPRGESIKLSRVERHLDLDYRRLMQQVYYYRDPIAYYKNFIQKDTTSYKDRFKRQSVLYKSC